MQRMFWQYNLCFQESANDNRNLSHSLEKMRLSATQKKTLRNYDFGVTKVWNTQNIVLHDLEKLTRKNEKWHTMVFQTLII